MVLATGCFASLGAMIWLNSPTMHPFQIVFLHHLFGFFTLVPLLARVGVQSLGTAKLGLYLSRGVISTVGMLLLGS